MADALSSGVPPFQRSFLHPRHWPVWLGMGLIWLLSLLPVRIRARLGKTIGNSVYRRNHKRRHIVLTNMELCFPGWTQDEREQRARRLFQVMGLSMLDYGQLWFSSHKRLLKQTALLGEEYIAECRREGRNVIVMAAHCVALDFGPSMMLRKGYPLIGPYNAAKNPIVDWLIARGRCRFKGRVFERDTGMMAYSRALKRGEYLFYLPDEDLGIEHSVFVPFFNTPKATLTTMGRLAKIGKAAVIPCITIFNGEACRYECHLLPALDDFPSGDEVRDARRINEALEDLIRIAPEQYLWTLKYFKTRPEGEPPAY